MKTLMVVLCLALGACGSLPDSTPRCVSVSLPGAPTAYVPACGGDYYVSCLAEDGMGPRTMCSDATHMPAVCLGSGLPPTCIPIVRDGGVTADH